MATSRASAQIKRGSKLKCLLLVEAQRRGQNLMQSHTKSSHECSSLRSSEGALAPAVGELKVSLLVELVARARTGRFAVTMFELDASVRLYCV